MSEMDDIFASDCNFAFFNGDEVGTTVTYAPVDADQVEDVPAHVGPEESQVIDGPSGRRQRRQRNVMIPRTGAVCVADPSVKARLVIGQEAWDVETIVSMDAAIATLRVVRDEPIERTREGYRRGR